MNDRLDDRDQQLIALLRSNARMSVVDMARKVGVSRATVQNRIKRMERQGVILAYSVKLRAPADVQLARMLVNVSLRAKNEATVIQALRGYPQVQAIHHTAGHWDLIVEVHAPNLPALNALLAEIRLIKGIEQTESNLLLDTLR